eukprot:Gregarina_sp_Poly_1__1507@NODE_137_length_13137_cov_148_628156_g122_i0_p2_GENE_NODE_137_length_13137_cov_148_628156_g122_i0NODE_137_length_13137_cov_148_628156_g122_i0_p2_ORF_typecomplete_len635_score112_99FF/PF01846_19/5_8e03FF/PF01846_19/5e07FF/PF01846_19/28FF/PF01846_19/0_64FF/PF01846_19/1_6WW/PF00397_26/4_7e08WW/PF00397_26/0_69RhoGAPFF1/PF16512_5/0_44Glyco_hyd_101C/PF17451_2/1_2Glyco_hyd_101C/PF17451_2/1e02Glyco_hyd_101C/PF17451_2/7_2e03_NODE_137_length_13137_cov_148_628156_g122_i06202524
MQPVSNLGGHTPPPPATGNSGLPLNLPPPPSTPATTAPNYPFPYQSNNAGVGPFAHSFVPMGGSFPGTVFPSIDPSMLATMASMLMPGVPGFNVPQPPERASPAEPQSQPPQTLWKEHRTNEGRIFWHNTKTGKSTWDKPDELKTDLEKVLATSTSWREYPGGDGKTYWHNLETKQSEWDTPKEVREIQERMEQLANEDWSAKVFDGKVQAKAEFRVFLERRGIGHKARWEDVGKIIQADKKWTVFDQFLTAGERKHVFNELVNQLQKRHREEQRVKKAAARDALSEFLSKWRAGEGENAMTPFATYEDFVQKATGEPWFHLLDTADKAEAFEETAQTTADEACKRPSKRKADELLQFFDDVGENELALETPAEGVVEFVRASFDDGWLTTMPPVAILNIWQRHVLDRPDVMRHKAKREMYRQERKVRETFKILLQDAEQEGLLDAKSEWSDFLNGPVPKKSRLNTQPPNTEVDRVLEKVRLRVKDWIFSDLQRSTEINDGIVEEGMREEESKESAASEYSRVCCDPRYLRMFFQGGSTPKEVFEDFVYELWDIYEELRPILKKHLTPASPLTEILCSAQIPTSEEFATFIEENQDVVVDPELWKAARRPGVLNPLVLSLAKKLRRGLLEDQNG